ncbi:hypothetical protein OWM07_10995 [Deferribacter thermophilus]|uniref:hypothetical protein n=1 Tax=Deferribacter thermophilus TaxID=53573 RepID=UPI003C22E491
MYFYKNFCLLKLFNLAIKNIINTFKVLSLVKELLNFLPEYNPEPVLLINSEAKILYKNKSADNILKIKIFHL